MFAASAAAARSGLSRSASVTARRTRTIIVNNNVPGVVGSGTRRNMGGGGHWMSVSKPHYYAGEICGFFTWLWVFYRAKHDLPVVLGLRHPWEHAHDPWAIHYHVEGEHALEEQWDEFAVKSTRPGEADDDDDDVEEEDDEEEDDDE